MYGETYGLMFWWVWAWMSRNAVWVNAVAHLCMFSGIFWMVFHNPDQPWHYKNPMWFAGLASLLCFISIGFQLALGGDFPFSYKNIGVIGETVFNCCWAFFFVSYLVQHRKL